MRQVNLIRVVLSFSYLLISLAVHVWNDDSFSLSNARKLMNLG